MNQDLAAMDSLQVSGIRCYGYTGFFPEERILGQWFEVSLTFWLDLSLSGKSDELGDTLDYSQAVSLVQDLVKTSRFKTIERLIDAIATTILNDTRAAQVKVRLTKLAPPIPDFSGQVTLEILRSQ